MLPKPAFDGPPKSPRSFASVWPHTDDFRSSPGNGHRQAGRHVSKVQNRLMRCSKQVLFDHLVGSHQYGGGHRSNVEGSGFTPQDVAGTTARDQYLRKAVPLTGKG